MTNTASIQDLSKRIEEVVQEHIATSHRVAAAALERAFAKAAAKPSAAGSMMVVLYLIHVVVR